MNEVKELFTKSEKIVFLTGAGVSVASGVKTFQELDDGWDFPEARAEIMSLPYFMQEPTKFWLAYRKHFSYIPSAQPSLFHQRLFDLESPNKDITVVTQNVDSLHTKAGSSQVLELHGSNRKLRCIDCFRAFSLSSALDESHGEELPVCTFCNTILKPDVSLFLEGVQDMDLAREAIRACDLLVVVGTSLKVGPVNELPFIAQYGKTTIVWVNTEAPPADYEFTHELIMTSDEFALQYLSPATIKSKNSFWKYLKRTKND